MAGAGRLGSFHAQKAAKHSGAVLSGVFDPFAKNRERIAEEHKIPGVDAPEKLLPLVDAVVVAAPSTLHFELGAFFLRAGKHVLMEKPLCADAREAETLAALADEKNLILQAGHVEQYNPAWGAALPFIRRSLAEGPVVIETVRQSGYTFRCVDVGATLDIMIHDLELILSILDAPVERVAARSVTEFGGLEDSVWADIEFADRSLARLFASRVEQTPRREMIVRSAARRINIDFAARAAETVEPSEEILRGGFAPERVDYETIRPAIPTFMKERYTTRRLEHDPFDALSLEMDNFIGAIRGTETSRAPGSRAAAAVRLAEQIMDAANEKKTGTR